MIHWIDRTCRGSVAPRQSHGSVISFEIAHTASQLARAEVKVSLIAP